MENSKKFAKEALNGSASSRLRLHRQEGTTHGAPTASGNMADSVRCLGPSSLASCHQLPCYQRRRINNDDLLASIDWHGQSLAECLFLTELALAMVRCRSPPEADSVEDRLAKAEAKITGETSVMTIAPFSFSFSRS